MAGAGRGPLEAFTDSKVINPFPFLFVIFVFSWSVIQIPNVPYFTSLFVTYRQGQALRRAGVKLLSTANKRKAGRGRLGLGLT